MSTRTTRRTAGSWSGSRRNAISPPTRSCCSLIEEHGGKFRVAFSLSGVILDQLEQYRPDVLESFQRLAATGCVEFLNETDSHSLAFLFSPREFQEQVERQRERIRALFGQEGRTFRHTELIYNNDLARTVGEDGLPGHPRRGGRKDPRPAEPEPGLPPRRLRRS